MRVEERRSGPPVDGGARSRLSSRLAWAVQIVVFLLWLYISLGVAWFTGGLQPWVYEWLS